MTTSHYQSNFPYHEIRKFHTSYKDKLYHHTTDMPPHAKRDSGKNKYITVSTFQLGGLEEVALSPPAGPWQRPGGGLGGKTLRKCIFDP